MNDIVQKSLLPMFYIFLAVLITVGTAFAGPTAYVGNFKDNTVSVVDVDAGRTVTTIPVDTGPHGMTLSADGRYLYVSSDGASTVSVLDTSTNRLVKKIDVGKGPHGVTFVPGQNLLLVAVNGGDKVAFVDTTTQSVVGDVRVGKPHTIAVSPDGRRAYISSQTPGHFALVVVLIPSRTVEESIMLNKTPRDLEYGYDGHIYFTEAGINAVEVFDPLTDRIIAEVPTGVSPHYVNHFRNTDYGMTVVQGPGELLLFDTNKYQPVRTIKVGKQPHWLAVSGDGRTAYVTNEGDNTLSVIDIASGKTGTITVGNQPRKVVVQSSGSSNKVSGVSIENFEFRPNTVTIASGDTVAWKNNDGSPHAVAFTDGTAGSGSLFPGNTFSRTFQKPGSYDYYCSIHTYMTGKVEVKNQ